MTTKKKFTLREARARAGLTQAAAARLALLSRNTLSEYERSVVTVRPLQKESVSRVYGLTADQIAWPETSGREAWRAARAAACRPRKRAARQPDRTTPKHHARARSSALPQPPTSTKRST